MTRRGLSLVIVGLPLAALSSGCSIGSAITGAQMAHRASKETTYLRVTLDGQEGKENKLKKAVAGYSGWKISEPVSTAPKLEYRITHPEKMGRITGVTVSLYREFEADFSHQPDFTIIAADTNNPEAQMKPETEYDLSNPGEGFKVLDLTSNQVERVEMEPGRRYTVLVTVRADRSQSAVIEFMTN
jgi:hypothetical protein